MSMDEELKQILSLVMNHNQDIEKVDLFIKLKNGNAFKYKVDRVKEFKIMEKIRKKQEKEKEKQMLKKENKNELK